MQVTAQKEGGGEGHAHLCFQCEDAATHLKSCVCSYLEEQSHINRDCFWAMEC